ncbi:unnamed protein product [Owenia fusiformis]|uniref:Uncharacterized protein n=1 Tax=Owenia fusiformis TaxID=6347 RepID=A0A8J1XJ98_OWEFU|nr:unnamed protein product [Owenia fusiformis]
MSQLFRNKVADRMQFINMDFFVYILLIMTMVEIVQSECVLRQSYNHEEVKIICSDRNSDDIITPIENKKKKHLIKKLDLSNNNLEGIPRQICDFENLISIDLSHNNLTALESDIFDNCSTLQRLNLSNNNLESIPRQICDFKNLNSIDLSHNNLTALESDIFDNCSTLQRLNLNNNKLRIIPTGLFAKLKDITRIDLSENNVADIQRNAFLDNYNLLYLNASYNNLTTMDTYTFQLLGQDRQKTPIEKQFDFSHNNLESFRSSSFHFDFTKAYRFYMDLRYNRFKYINLELVQPFHLTKLSDLFALFAIDGFLYIDLSKNPIICDCNMYDTQKIVKSVMSLPGQLYEFTIWESRSLICMYPPQLQDHRLIEVHEDDLVCNITENCPVNCTCIRKPNVKRLAIECKNKQLADLPQKLPSVQYGINEKIDLDVSDNNIEELHYRPYFNDLATLDAQNNQIKYIASSALENLTSMEQLVLNNNKLRYLPNKISVFPFVGLKNISLHQNPLECTCDTFWIKAWLWSLSERRVLHKSRHITCTSGSAPIMEHDFNEELCNVNWGIVAGIPVSVTFLITIILVNLYCFKNVLILLIRKKRKYPEHPEGKEYDAFVGYVTEDVRWIRNVLIPILEPKYKLCIHNRDFVVGRTIADNIADAIEKSQRTIMVLSPRFLESGWCKEEFLVAHRQYMLHPSQVLIPILLDDFEHDLPTIPNYVKCYLQTHTYMEANDLLFDLKLESQMPQTTVSECMNIMTHQV